MPPPTRIVAGDLTRYEQARLLEHRARQLEANQRPLVAVPAGVTCPIAVAMLELQAGVLSCRIRRLGPGGDAESRRVAAEDDAGADGEGAGR